MAYFDNCDGDLRIGNFAVEFVADQGSQLHCCQTCDFHIMIQGEIDVSFSVDGNCSGYFRVLPDVKLNDVSGMDTVFECRGRRYRRLFLCVQGCAAGDGARQERCGDPNSKGLRFEHGDFLLRLIWIYLLEQYSHRLLRGHTSRQDSEVEILRPSFSDGLRMAK